MTNPEIYEQLKLVDEPTWVRIKELLSEESSDNRSNYLQRIDKQNPTPMDYLVCAICEDDYNGRANRHSVDYKTLENSCIYRRGNNRNRHYTFIENLPSEIYEYLPSNIATRLKKEARKLEVKNNTKQLQLNEFSYQMFKAQLEISKYKITGNEAIAQINTLPNPTSQQEKEYYDKFLALFWDSLPKKSIQFCDIVIIKNKYTIYSPIKVISVNTDLTPTDFTTNEVYISLWDYQYMARQHSIPVLPELHTDRYSDHHDWVSGVPKATPLTQIQLEMTISQVIILDYLIQYIQPEGCPYFTKMKSHIMNELANPIYRDKLQTLLPQMHTAYTTALDTIKDMNGLLSVSN